MKYNCEYILPERMFRMGSGWDPALVDQALKIGGNQA